MLANQDIQKLYWRIKNPDALSATGTNSGSTDRAFVKSKRSDFGR